MGRNLYPGLWPYQGCTWCLKAGMGCCLRNHLEGCGPGRNHELTTKCHSIGFKQVWIKVGTRRLNPNTAAIVILHILMLQPRHMDGDHHLAKVPELVGTFGRIVEPCSYWCNLWGGGTSWPSGERGSVHQTDYRCRGLGHIITHVIRQGSQGSMLGSDFTSALLGSRWRTHYPGYPWE